MKMHALVSVVTVAAALVMSPGLLPRLAAEPRASQSQAKASTPDLTGIWVPAKNTQGLPAVQLFSRGGSPDAAVAAEAMRTCRLRNGAAGPALMTTTWIRT